MGNYCTTMETMVQIATVEKFVLISSHLWQSFGRSYCYLYQWDVAGTQWNNRGARKSALAPSKNSIGILDLVVTYCFLHFCNITFLAIRSQKHNIQICTVYEKVIWMCMKCCGNYKHKT